MNGFLIFLIIVIVLTLGYLKEKSIASDLSYLPYKKKECLMTKAERDFFSVLGEVIKDKYYIIPQVNLSNIAYVNKKDGYYKYLNKIDRKTIDFVLFDKYTFSPVIAIELDDNSHNEEARKNRDNFVDRVMEKIEVKIIHVKTAYTYNLEEISRIIFNPEINKA